MINEELKKLLIESKNLIKDYTYKNLVDSAINANDINLEDEDSRTLLSWNIRQSFTPLELLEKLILNGANVNQIERYGITPLMIAAKYGYDDKAKILLENNANIYAKDAYGRTSIDISSESGASNVLDLLNLKKYGIFVETMRYKDLEWYIINETDVEKLLLLRKTFTKEMIQKYFDMYDKNFNVKFNLDIRKSWWDESYIREILNKKFLLDLDKNDLNVMQFYILMKDRGILQ